MAADSTKRAEASKSQVHRDIEIYTPERQAEFLLNNALTATDYEIAVAQVRAMGVDPESIEHEPPARTQDG